MEVIKVNREELIEELQMIKNDINNLKIEKGYVAGNLCFWGAMTLYKSKNLLDSPNVFRAAAVGICALAVGIYEFHLSMDNEQLKSLEDEQLEMERDTYQKQMTL